MVRSLLLLLMLFVATSASGQILDAQSEPSDAKLGDPVTVRYRVGVEIKASRGACQGIVAMVAVPYTGAEQEIKVVSEEFSSDVDKVEFRELGGGGAKLMEIKVSSLPKGAVAKAIMTYEVSTRPVLPPDEKLVAGLSIPAKPDRELKAFLSPSPFIEARDKKIRSLAREIWTTTESTESEAALTDWQRIELLYDYVIDNIDYVEGDDKSALTTLRDEQADCHGRSALFVALCRAHGIPARIVWVHNHCFAEFYLENAEGQGTWFPAESAGTRAFGYMPLARVIMQKGDDFRDPFRRGERLRYATDLAKGFGDPKVKFIREQVE
jgi:hypothetical protein